jgi:hypothetical protein
MSQFNRRRGMGGEDREPISSLVIAASNWRTRIAMNLGTKSLRGGGGREEK